MPRHAYDRDAAALLHPARPLVMRRRPLRRARSAPLPVRPVCMCYDRHLPPTVVVPPAVLVIANAIRNSRIATYRLPYLLRGLDARCASDLSQKQTLEQLRRYGEPLWKDDHCRLRAVFASAVSVSEERSYITVRDWAGALPLLFCRPPLPSLPPPAPSHLVRTAVQAALNSLGPIVDETARRAAMRAGMAVLPSRTPVLPPRVAAALLREANLRARRCVLLRMQHGRVWCAEHRPPSLQIFADATKLRGGTRTALSAQGRALHCRIRMDA